MGTLVLLENRDFGPNGLIAVPEKLYDLHRITYGLEEIFFEPRKLPNITEDDFNIYEWCEGCIPIKAAESLGYPKQEIIDDIVKYGIDSMNEHKGSKIDAEAVITNGHLTSMLFDRERIDTIAYLVKFKGKYKLQALGLEEVEWNAIFLAGAGDNIRLTHDKSELELNGQSSDLRTVSNEYGPSYEGTLELSKPGELELRRGSLKPYRKSDYSIIKSYESGPWIRLDTKGTYLKGQTK
jgi:hypothetical protein